jgi:hypothetical protein
MKRSNIVGVNNQLEVEKSDDVIAGIDQLSPENKPLKILRLYVKFFPFLCKLLLKNSLNCYFQMKNFLLICYVKLVHM